MTTTRRQFLTALGATSTSIGLGTIGLKARTALSADSGETASPEWPIAIFEKVFEALSYDQLADAVAQIGADGVEATIRSGGHIEPQAAAEEVPKMRAALGARGKRIVIAATHIRRVDEPHTESLLKTLAANGVTHYRTGHYYLELDQPLKRQVANYASQVRELAALNREVGIQGLYQNHSGSSRGRGYLGALGWDAALMLEGIDPDALGMALDTRHLRKDTGSSWKTAVAVCKPHIRSVYVKDGIWKGPRGDQYEDVALDTGFVNREVFRHIVEGLRPMPLCIHMEWLGYRVFERHEIPSAIEAHQKDIAALRRWMG